MTAPQTPAPAVPRPLEVRLLALAAAWEDKAAAQRELSRAMDDRADAMHLAGQATGHMDAALALRTFLADLNETERP